MIQYTQLKDSNYASDQVKLSFLILTVLGGITDCAWAENDQMIASGSFFNNVADARKDRLNRIHASLFAAKTNISSLDRDVKELINNYKNHLQKFGAAKTLGEIDNPLLKDIGLLLAKLEAGYESQIKDQMQAKNCYDLISAIESLFEKLENPQEDSFDELAFPQQSNGIIKPYKKLKGEKLPCHATTNRKKKKPYEKDDLTPIVLFQAKISKPASEIFEEDK